MTVPLAIQTLKVLFDTLVTVITENSFQKEKDIESSLLLNVARNLATSRFPEIANNIEFTSLPCDELENIIQSNCLNVKSEEDVYYAVMKWINSDLQVADR